MIYIHVPFCRSFCIYCDFYSEVAGDVAGASAKNFRKRLSSSRFEDRFERYTDDLCGEIEARRDEIAASSAVRTLYIGGGTPSLLPTGCLQKIVRCLSPERLWDEFTLEVNPEDIVERGEDYVRGLLELGVNRISMGVQSLDDGMLRWMNRPHSADGAREAFRILRNCGVRNISTDLITGVPGMSMEMLEKTVEEVLCWRPEHISAYQLSIEEGSALAKMTASGKVSELPDEECRAQYDMLCSRLRQAGYHHYEISNWALPGREAVHNSAYWTRAPYVGLGPGAHSLTYLDASGKAVRPQDMEAGTQRRSWNSQKPYGWSVEGSEILTAEEIREEEVMLLSRTEAGPIPEKDWFIADELILEKV